MARIKGAIRCECVGCYEDATERVVVMKSEFGLWTIAPAGLGEQHYVCAFHEDKIRRPDGYLTVFREAK